MKRFTKGNQQAKSMHYKRGVPADVNTKFLSRRVDAAFISSISARKHLHVGLGIIAKKEVLSVLVIPNEKSSADKESATSNVLTKVLNVKGEVLIGDKALKYYLSGAPHVDLAKEWNDRYNLPFVFALLCHHPKDKIYKEIEHNFLKQNIKIPQYLLKQASTRTGVAPKDILNYLKYISYDLDKKAQMGLKKFYNKVSYTNA